MIRYSNQTEVSNLYMFFCFLIFICFEIQSLTLKQEIRTNLKDFIYPYIVCNILFYEIKCSQNIY